MAKCVKMCDMKAHIAVKVFEMLNPNRVKVIMDSQLLVLTDIEPKELVYPEGWYYAKGAFRNKHTSTTGIYEEVPMLTSDGELWCDLATYCTLA